MAETTMSNTYWFQVGAWGESNSGYADKFGQPITGASVEVRILDQKLNHVDTDDSYWVGVDLPNDAFIQAGYMMNPQYNSGHPSLFWEYFLPGTAKENTGGFLGNEGRTAGMNGTWVKFSLASTGTIWSAFANDQQLGQVDLSVGDSGGSGPDAVAESAQTYWTDNVLGPVEFRNLSYRDSTGVWHQASAAASLCCYGVTSATYNGGFPYGVESVTGENNHWLAGSGLPIKAEGQSLWPWFYVSVTSSVGSAMGNGWYVEGSEVAPQAQLTVPISGGERYYLEGWTDGTYTASGFAADQNMSLSAVYVKQYLVTVTSTLGSTFGSGWYDAGIDVKIGVRPTSIQAEGILGALGVRSIFGGWGGDYTGSPRPDGSSLITVNAPMTIHAEWSLNPGTILPASAVIIIAIVSVGAVTLKRRNKVQFCLNCGHRLPSGSLFCLKCGRRQDLNRK
jgi:ribosomal protein L40E